MSWIKLHSSFKHPTHQIFNCILWSTLHIHQNTLPSCQNHNTFSLHNFTQSAFLSNNSYPLPPPTYFFSHGDLPKTAIKPLYPHNPPLQKSFFVIATHPVKPSYHSPPYTLPLQKHFYHNVTHPVHSPPIPNPYKNAFMTLGPTLYSHHTTLPQLKLT